MDDDDDYVHVVQYSVRVLKMVPLNHRTKKKKGRRKTNGETGNTILYKCQPAEESKGTIIRRKRRWEREKLNI